VTPGLLEHYNYEREVIGWTQACSTTGSIIFARDLLGTSSAFQNYVIVHELLHLRVPNHGRLFKSYLTACIFAGLETEWAFVSRSEL
jgi:hypothetical protein